ncbi:MAG: glycosyltransferase family 2 protein [Bosea sp. (in: a-proteobacteria)]
MATSSPATQRALFAEVRPKPLLSILCPTYNRKRFIERFLSHHVDGFSGLAGGVELLVSDNGSSDGSRDLIRAEAATHPMIRVVEQPENLGAYGNVLYCNRQARGEFAAYLGDDDLLIPEAVARAVAYLQKNPSCVMLQAPWLMVDEAAGNIVTGQFYQLDGVHQFQRGQHGACLDFVLKGHIFPESYILRTSAIPRIVSPAHEHAFLFFTQLSRALDVGDVLFSPEPFAKMTVGAHDQAGHAEVMTGWDRYRGGLEYMAAQARKGDASALGDVSGFLIRMQQFVCHRMVVAMRLHVAAGNWRDAFYLGERLNAYGVPLPALPDMENIAALAGLQTCFAEAAMMKRALVVLDSKVPEMFVEALNARSRLPFVRPADPQSRGQASKAHIVLGPKPGWPVSADDIVLDLSAAIAQFE